MADLGAYLSREYGVVISDEIIGAGGIGGGGGGGGLASGFLFHKYMADLGAYLSREYGVVISDEISAHLLWADDLILFFDTQHGIQKQLEGLHTFFVNNHMMAVIFGYNKWDTQVFDRLFQHFVRCTLHIKATTCNHIVYGECGRFPPSVYCHINVLCYYRRLLGMSENSNWKSVFNGLYRLHQQGFPTWIGRTCALAEQYDKYLNGTMDMLIETFKPTVPRWLNAIS